MSLNYFDKIYVIGVENSSQNIRLKEEFKELGILDENIYWYITPRIANLNINKSSKCKICCDKLCFELFKYCVLYVLACACMCMNWHVLSCIVVYVLFMFGCPELRSWSPRPSPFGQIP